MKQTRCRIFLPLTILVLLLARCQNTTGDYCNGHLYCGKTGDTICEQDILRAEESVKNGKIYLCTYCGPFNCGERYSEWVDSACSTFGLLHGTELGNCDGPDAPDPNCFCHYMDKYLRTKFGKSFKNKVLRLADSLYVINSLDRIVNSWEADTRDKELINEKRINSFINYRNVTVERDDYSHPYIKLNLIIDTSLNIKIKNYRWEDSLGLSPKEQRNLEQQLFSTLKRTKADLPCKLWQFKVACRYEFSFSFEKERFNIKDYYTELMKKKNFSLSAYDGCKDALSDTLHERGIGYIEKKEIMDDVMFIDFKFKDACCKKFMGDYEISGNTLTFLFEPVNSEECTCMCWYRYKLTIKKPKLPFKQIVIRQKSTLLIQNNFRTCCKKVV